MGRQISALLTQVDAKKRDFFEFVAKELQELQDCGKIKEVRSVFYCLILKISFFVTISYFFCDKISYVICFELFVILNLFNLQEHAELLRNTPVQEDYSEILLEVAQSLDSYSSQYLKENIKKNVSSKINSNLLCYDLIIMI